MFLILVQPSLARGMLGFSAVLPALLMKRSGKGHFNRSERLAARRLLVVRAKLFLNPKVQIAIVSALRVPDDRGTFHALH